MAAILRFLEGGAMAITLGCKNGIRSLWGKAGKERYCGGDAVVKVQSFGGYLTRGSGCGRFCRARGCKWLVCGVWKFQRFFSTARINSAMSNMVFDI